MKKLISLVVVCFACLVAANAFAEPVDINSADAKALAANVKGIGPKKAEAIVAYRQKHGPFKKIEDLKSVKGIGAKFIEKNRQNLLIVQTPQKITKPD